MDGVNGVTCEPHDLYVVISVSTSHIHSSAAIRRHSKVNSKMWVFAYFFILSFSHDDYTNVDSPKKGHRPNKSFKMGLKIYE